jgi:hypothetical protein
VTTKRMQQIYDGVLRIKKFDLTSGGVISLSYIRESFVIMRELLDAERASPEEKDAFVQTVQHAIHEGVWRVEADLLVVSDALTSAFAGVVQNTSTRVVSPCLRPVRFIPLD